MHPEMYKTLMKEIKVALNKWKNKLCSCFGRLSMVNISILKKLISRFTKISIKIPSYFCDIDNLVLNSVWKGRISRKSKTISKKKGKVK